MKYLLGALLLPLQATSHNNALGRHPMMPFYR